MAGKMWVIERFAGRVRKRKREKPDGKRVSVRHGTSSESARLAADDRSTCL